MERRSAKKELARGRDVVYGAMGKFVRHADGLAGYFANVDDDERWFFLVQWVRLDGVMENRTIYPFLLFLSLIHLSQTFP